MRHSVLICSLRSTTNKRNNRVGVVAYGRHEATGTANRGAADTRRSSPLSASGDLELVTSCCWSASSSATLTCVPDWPFTSVTGRHVHRHHNQYPIRWAADVDGTGSDLLFSPGPCMNAKPSQSYSASTRSAWRLPFFRSKQPDRICSATRHRSGRFRFECHCSPLTCVLRRPSYADKRRRCPWRTAMGWLC